MGKSSPDPPDYRPLAQASEEAARIGAELGREQLEFARVQYQDAKPFLQRIASAQEGMMQQQQDQAADYYRYNVGTYRPLERGLVRDAERFNTSQYRQGIQARAAADASRAFSQGQQALTRSMGAMGVNPSSPRYAALVQQNATQNAAQRAAAMTQAGERADQMGYARRLEVSGLGRNLPGTANAAYAGALGAGNSAGQNFQSPGQNYMAGQAAANATTMSGQQARIQGLGTVLNAQTNAYVNGQSDSPLGAIGGILGGAASLYNAFSDRRLKTEIEFSHVDEGTGLNLYTFRYLHDMAHKYLGVMADEVQKVFPDAVRPRDGYLTVDYGALGLKLEVV